MSLTVSVLLNLQQRREREVHSLLEKLPATTITLDPRRLGMIDEAPRTLLIEEEANAKRELIELKANNEGKKKKRTSASAQRFVSVFYYDYMNHLLSFIEQADQKKYGELKKKLAQKRQIEAKLEERGKNQEERLAEEKDKEDQLEGNQQNNDELKTKESTKDVLDR